jgi:Bacterial dnaA protein helix-turn-helix
MHLYRRGMTSVAESLLKDGRVRPRVPCLFGCSAVVPRYRRGVWHKYGPWPEPPEVNSATIMGQTASYFGLTVNDLCGTSRSRLLVAARQIAMYLCRELTDMSRLEIGQQFGGRDDKAVVKAERRIRWLMAERRAIYDHVTELTNRIKQQAMSGSLPPLN